MSLVLKQFVRTNIYGTEVWITDRTAAYSTTNTGGWGVPNPTLAKSALVALIKYTDSGIDTWLKAITGQVAHNPLALDSDVNHFGFTFFRDGHYTGYLIRLRVSNNGGTSDLDNVAISEGNYFAIGTIVYQKVGGVNVEIPAADYPKLIAIDTLTKSICETMFYNKLWIKVRDFYKEGMDFRNENSRESAEQAFIQHDDLKRDIMGADYTFRSGLKLQAESIVKNLLDKYQIR